MSWEDAQEAASKWLGEQRLGRDLYNQEVDLSAAPIEHTGMFRRMVLVAVRRKLVKRGAKTIILPPGE